METFPDPSSLQSTSGETVTSAYSGYSDGPSTSDYGSLGFASKNVSECPQQAFINAAERHELPTPLLIFISLPATAIILLTIFGNLLVLCFKARVGRTNTTLLVWNLGLTDFLVGVVVLPMGAVYLISRKWVFGRILCRIWVAADVTFCTCSVVTICIISADRYLAVTRPLRYKSLVTKFKVIGIMISIWTFSSLILLTTVKWETNKCADESICYAGNEIRYLAHSVVFAFFIPASVTLTLYWRIYRLARNRQKALDRGFLMILGHNMNFLTNTISQNATLRVHFGNNNGMVEHQRRVLRTHERIAKTLGVVSCSFLFCWLPFFSLYLTNYQCKGCVPTIAIDIASWLGYCNSMINPIIYSFTVKDFKRSALRLILPIWQFVFHCLPVKILPKPPDRIARVSRSGQKAKNRRNNNLLDGRTRACRNAYGGAANGKSRQLISETTYNKTVPTILPETVDHDRQSSNSSDNDELINIASVDDFNDPSILTDPTTTTSDTFCATKNFRWAKRKRNSSCKEPLTITTNHMNTTRSTPTKLSEWLDKTRKSRKNAEDSPLAKTDDSSLTNSFHSVKLATKMKKRWAFGQKRCSQSMDQPDDESLDTPDIEDMKKSLNLIESRRGTLLNDEGLTITQIRRGTLNKSTTIDCSGLSSDSTETPLLSYRQIECRGAAHVIRESITRKIEQYHNSSHDEQIEDPGATKTTRSDDDHPEDPCTPRPIRYRTYRHRDSQPQHSTGEVKSEDKLTANTGCNTSKGSVESVRIYLLTEEENV